nr:MAG TPA: hypothetical protein [Caudoviricetes sp.]
MMGALYIHNQSICFYSYHLQILVNLVVYTSIPIVDVVEPIDQIDLLAYLQSVV